MSKLKTIFKKTGVFLSFWLAFFFLKKESVFSQQVCNPDTDPMCISLPTPSAGVKSINTLISAGITTAIVIAGLLTFIFLIWGGLQWLTSGGDKSKYEAARDRITAAVIGLAIVAVAWALMTVIGNFFGFTFYNINIPSAASPGPESVSGSTGR